MNKQSVCLLLIDMETRMINRNLTNEGRYKWTLRKLRHILKRKTFSMKSFGRITEYTESVVECFDSVPEVAKPLIGSAGRLLNRIEKMLYSAPAFVGAVKAVIPEEA